MTLRPIFSLVLAAAALLAMERPALAQRMHYLGIAGDGDEAVFRSEVLGARRALDASWSLASSRTVGGALRGGATYGAVRRSIRRAAEGMDREKDVLFLLISAHGGRAGRGVELSGGGGMTPRMLRAALDEAGIKNRVLVVSACYSGQFVPPLADPNTAVITAADATSFALGCLSRCPYTDFGYGFFNQGLPKAGRDLRRAFAIADAAATALARRDGERPSRPQLSMGAEIERTLRSVR